MPGEKKNKNNYKIPVFFFLIVIFFIAGYSVIRIYHYIYKPNVVIRNDDHDFLLIPTGSDFHKVKNILSSKGIIKNKNSFEWVAEKKNYPKQVKPGRYMITNGMNNNELVNLLRSGKQTPVRVTFQNVRTIRELAGKIGHQLEPDSVAFLTLLENKEFLNKFGVTPETAIALFIPDTYEFYWNTSAKEFIRRMNLEHLKFWNRERSEKAASLGMTILQVITLASIIDRETAKDSEKPDIAGVYINRLRKGWPLQADPTLIFAWNDYSIRRVLNKHKEIKSPYNTYIHTGLPPGPICLPSVSSIESVLQNKKSNLLYFCAKADLSGYHCFSATLAEHNRNAAKYQAALKKLNIH